MSLYPILKNVTLICLMSALSVVCAFAQNKVSISRNLPRKGIKFDNISWKEVLINAKKSGKLIFIDAYASWCGPCKLLKSTTFNDKNVAAYFNSHFINYSIDVEKGEGIELADSWGIATYPTLLFFSPDGVLAKQEGYLDATQLLSLAKSVVIK